MNKLDDPKWRKDPERVVIHNDHKPDPLNGRCVRCGATLKELKAASPEGIVCMGAQGDGTGDPA